MKSSRWECPLQPAGLSKDSLKYRSMEERTLVSVKSSEREVALAGEDGPAENQLSDEMSNVEI